MAKDGWQGDWQCNESLPSLIASLPSLISQPMSHDCIIAQLSQQCNESLPRQIASLPRQIGNAQVIAQPDDITAQADEQWDESLPSWLSRLESSGPVWPGQTSLDQTGLDPLG